MNTNENMSIMYKIVSAKNPDFVNKQFRVFSDKNTKGYRIVIFDGDVKRKCNFVKHLQPEDVVKFYKDTEIKYQIDKEYGKRVIEFYERTASTLRSLYEVLPDGVIDPLSLSAVCSSTDNQIDFKMEPNKELEKGDI